MIFNIKNENEKMLLFPPLNIDYGEIKHYWSKDYGFLIDNIIKDNKEYLLYSPLAQEKKLSRYSSINKKKTKKKSKRESKRKSRKNLKRELVGNTNNEEDKISDIKKNLERIDNIYKQIVNL